MNTVEVSQDLVLEPADNSRLANLCGQFDEHLRQIERRLNVNIASRGNRFRVTGKPGAARVGSDVLRSLFSLTEAERLDPERVHIALQETVMNDGEIEIDDVDREEPASDRFEIQTRRKLVRARGVNQRGYVKNIREHDLGFRYRPGWYGENLPGSCECDRRAGERTGTPHYSGASRGRGRGAPGVSAGRHVTEDRSLFAADVRRIVRHGGPGTGRTID